MTLPCRWNWSARSAVPSGCRRMPTDIPPRGGVEMACGRPPPGQRTRPPNQRRVRAAERTVRPRGVSLEGRGHPTRRGNPPSSRLGARPDILPGPRIIPSPIDPPGLTRLRLGRVVGRGGGWVLESSWLRTHPSWPQEAGPRASPEGRGGGVVKKDPDPVARHTPPGATAATPVTAPPLLTAFPLSSSPLPPQRSKDQPPRPGFQTHTPLRPPRPPRFVVLCRSCICFVLPPEPSSAFVHHRERLREPFLCG